MDCTDVFNCGAETGRGTCVSHNFCQCNEGYLPDADVGCAYDEAYWEEANKKGPNLGLILGASGAGLAVLVLVGTGVYLYRKADHSKGTSDDDILGQLGVDKKKKGKKEEKAAAPAAKPPKGPPGGATEMTEPAKPQKAPKPSYDVAPQVGGYPNQYMQQAQTAQYQQGGWGGSMGGSMNGGSMNGGSMNGAASYYQAAPQTTQYAGAYQQQSGYSQTGMW
eukprot:CAMPEP_0170739054 /NCGR_PEP_ID=MMETSP0437-20130122/4963_1 /TAXON_ID=0 /ORGANISM="Sexangularia sp." /LENGTH=220 /DNA_ID=CAMNT_0011077497 /DNA_START=215 /DNA_END=877 /DNA_ORIENTATION=-